MSKIFLMFIKIQTDIRAVGLLELLKILKFLTLVLTNESHLIFTKFAHYHVHKLTADWQQTVKLTLIGLAVHQIHVLSRYLLFTET